MKPTASDLGALLAKLRWSKTTKEARSEHARKMAKARWAKRNDINAQERGKEG